MRRDKEWWLARDRREGNLAIGAGVPPVSNELALLLTVARVLRARISTADPWGVDDIAALDEALEPWSPLPVEPINEAASSSPTKEKSDG